MSTLAGHAVPALPAALLAGVTPLVEHASSVELKFSVPDTDQRSAVAALGMDPLDGQIGQVAFFDTPSLDLYRHGVVVRVRRSRRAPDSVVKLRPVVPGQEPIWLRESPAVGVEVDAMPGGFVCSAAMKASCSDAEAKRVFAGGRPLRALLTEEQKVFFRSHAPADVDLDALSMLGPLNVLELRLGSPDLGRRLVAELWLYHDGTRILEVSSRTVPSEAFEVATATKDFLEARGIARFGAQPTKTKAALEHYAREQER